MSEYYLTKDELYHHGIKGQKWGLRRFQNEDGSLTTAGRERYGQIAKNVAKGALGLFKAANKVSNDTRESMKDGLKKTNQPKGTIGEQLEKSSKRQEKMSNPGEIKILDKEKITAKLKDPKVQKAIKIGVAVAGTALAAYGGYKLAKYLGDKKTQRAIKTAKSMLSTSKFMGTLAEKYAGIAENYGTEAKSKPRLGNYYNNGGKYTGIFRTTTPGGRDYSAYKTEYNPEKYRKYINKYETYRERANQYGDAGRSLMDIATGSNFRVSNSDPYALNARYVKLKK